MQATPLLKTLLPRITTQTKPPLPFSIFKFATGTRNLNTSIPRFTPFSSPSPSSSHSTTSILSSLRSLPSKPFSSPSSRFLSTATANSSRAKDEVDWTKIGMNVGLAAVGAFGLNYALNRETRGGLTEGESSYLNETFMWTGAGLAITTATAFFLHRNGVAARLMSLNPWVFMGVGLAASVGSMMGVYYTAPGTIQHTVCWAAFSALQGVTLSPMFFLNPAILSRAGLYTVGALGGLCYVGATAESEQFLYIGGFLMAGLGVLIATSLAPMLLPKMGLRTMSILEHVSAYGGVALFSGFILYDTQKILKHAKLAEQGRMIRDPIRESVSLILDAINLFVRIVQVLMLQQRKK